MRRPTTRAPRRLPSRALPLLVLLALVASPPLAARAQDARPATAADARAVLRLEDQWTASVVRRDAAAFQRLLAPGFVYTENDRLMTREELVREIVGGSDTVTAARNEGMQAHRFASTIVVTGWLLMSGRGAAGPFDRRYRYTDTWARIGGRWRIVAAQDYLVPEVGK